MDILNITDYGARGDGKIVCTEAIQRTIDLCPKNGTVLIPKGVFISGALFLKSDMTLYVEEGARLLGSSDINDFPAMTYSFEGYDQLCYASLINTDSAPHRNITIDGKGTIDANGAALFKSEMRESKGKRGRIVCIRNTDKVIIKNITLRQSPSWGLHLIYCNDVVLDNISVHTKYDENGRKYEGIYNGDGIDIDSCKNVKITNSLVASQDDCISVKSGRDVIGRRTGIPSENVTIENCVFKSGFGAAMGSEMSGGVSDVLVKDCKFENTHSIASIKAIRGRGGYIKNIHYENCTLVNENTEISDTRWFRGALYADGFYGEEEFDADKTRQTDEGTPYVENLSFKNITLRTVAGNAIYLCGLPESHYRNVSLENVRAHGKYGMKIKNIDNLTLTNVNVTSDYE